MEEEVLDMCYLSAIGSVNDFYKWSVKLDTEAEVTTINETALAKLGRQCSTEFSPCKGVFMGLIESHSRLLEN